MAHIISKTVRINRQKAIRNNVPLLPVAFAELLSPEAIYRQLQYSYPKFFKMDLLSKWAWIGAEALLTEGNRTIYEGIDKNNIAVVLMTSQGCLDADKKYRESMNTIPSPALFVYTLSNIMHGEICIRHGFKGEQACLVNDQFDTRELYLYVSDILENRGMDACVCGWVDASSENADLCMYWVQKGNNNEVFSPDLMLQLYNS